MKQGARTIRAAVRRYVAHDCPPWRWHDYLTNRLWRVHEETYLADVGDYVAMRHAEDQRRRGVPPADRAAGWTRDASAAFSR